MIKKYIQVNVEIEAIHNWPDCNIPEVDYLKYPHRHAFIFSCKLEVNDSNREVEFIKLKHDIKSFIGSNFYDKTFRCCNFLGRSCEQLAELVFMQFGLVSCSVSEDGEFAGIVERG